MGFQIKFDTDGLKRKLEKQMLAAVRKKHGEIARTMSCSEHHRSATVTFEGHDLKTHKTVISCCCEPFKKSLLNRMGAK